MPGVSVVKPQYGPTLPQLVRRLPRARAGRRRRARRAAHRPRGRAHAARAPRRDARHRPRRRRRSTSPTGRSCGASRSPARCWRCAASAPACSWTPTSCARCTLPPYRGAAGGMLPVYAVRVPAAAAQALRRRRPRRSRAARGSTTPSATSSCCAASCGARTLYVRHLLLVPEEPEGVRRGVDPRARVDARGRDARTPSGSATPARSSRRCARFASATSREGGTQ